MNPLNHFRDWLFQPVITRLEKIVSKVDELIASVVALDESVSAELQAIADELAQFGTDDAKVQEAIDRILATKQRIDEQTAALRENDPPADPEPPVDG